MKRGTRPRLDPGCEDVLIVVAPSSRVRLGRRGDPACDLVVDRLTNAGPMAPDFASQEALTPLLRDHALPGRKTVQSSGRSVGHLSDAAKGEHCAKCEPLNTRFTTVNPKICKGL
jgi:hypothetical protein